MNKTKLPIFQFVCRAGDVKAMASLRAHQAVYLRDFRRLSPEQAEAEAERGVGLMLLAMAFVLALAFAYALMGCAPMRALPEPEPSTPSKTITVASERHTSLSWNNE